MWVLVFVGFGYGAFTENFYTEQACKDALAVIEQVQTADHVAACVWKGG